MRQIYFLQPLRIDHSKIALDIGISLEILKGIVEGKYSINDDISSRLGKYFKMREDFFLRLQKIYDLEESKNQILIY